MATVTKWTPFGVALDITANAASVTRTSATQYTVKFNVSWETYYSGAATKYGMTASSGGSTVTLKTFSNTAASSGSGTLTGTYSISGNGSATKTVVVTFRNFNDDNSDSATKAVNVSVTVPAWTSYTIKYNANGGSGVPGNQTKWKGQTLKLSTTKPTRTGYTFLGWSTSSTATSATYTAGANYTADSAATLYAVWKAITYTVSYNANGGSGAPGNQTKTYGVNLTLSSTKPTRTNYNFKGWGTSASATTVSYAAGSTYTNNAAITLYAIWELAYIKPRISNVSVVRCNSSGTATDDGTNGLVTFDWECDKTVSSIVVKWKLPSASTWTSSTVTATGTSGTVSHVIGSNLLSIDLTYDVHITVTDSGGSSYATSSLTSMAFTIDFLAGGKGVAFGKAAELEGVAEFNFDGKFNKPVYGNALGMNKLPEIPANDDLNNYMETGCYAVYRNDNASTIANIPVARAGRLEVWSSTGEGIRSEEWSYLTQRYVPYNLDNAVWEREISRGEDNVWTYGAWVRTSLSKAASERVYREPKVLWSGGYYMTAGHTITLSEAISKQNNGIVLVFSAFTDNAVGNYWWHHFFVPKQIVTNNSGTGHCFTLASGNFSLVAMKYLMIKDTQITGHDNNNLTGTAASGITFTNNRFVLRYVLGV